MDASALLLQNSRMTIRFYKKISKLKNPNKEQT